MKVESPVVPDALDAWHALEPAQVERLLDTGGHDLTAAEAQARLGRHGRNAVTAAAGSWTSPRPVSTSAGPFIGSNGDVAEVHRLLGTADP